MNQLLASLPESWRDRFIFPNGCWVWTGANSCQRIPYAVVRIRTRRVHLHKLLYARAYMPELEPHQLPMIFNTCGRPLCVNPDH